MGGLGELLHLLKRKFKGAGPEGHRPNLIMHSFCGAKEIAIALQKIQHAHVYFSFCQVKSQVGVVSASGLKRR